MKSFGKKSNVIQMRNITGSMALFPIEIEISNFAQIFIHSCRTDLRGVAGKIAP